MDDIRNHQMSYFTVDGITALTNRLKSLWSIYKETSEAQYPVDLPMLGFGFCRLESKEQCLGHINELQQLLLVKVSEE